MPSGNWSFPCSPRNPAKVREELRLLGSLAPSWRVRGMVWSPRSGAQLEFGRQLRDGGDDVSPRASSPGDDEAQDLRFQTQAVALSDDNLRWTARARFGTYKFFGFVTTHGEGYATLTSAGRRFVAAAQPGEVLLRQLLKWQYPDNQHRGTRWPAADFAIRPFIATARLIRELGGLTRQEIALFCFTMRRTEEAAATAEAVRQLRQRQARSVGRTGKARAVHLAREVARTRYETEGKRVVMASMDDYADALIRYFRYTGLFSVRGARIVVAQGRERELDELIFPLAGSVTDNSGGPAPIQLALGEAPPVRLAAPVPLNPDYDDAGRFYTYFGDDAVPRLPWEDPARLAAIVRELDLAVAELTEREAQLRSGRAVLAGPQLGDRLPDGYDALSDLVIQLRRQKQRLEQSIYEQESRSPERLSEALDAYGAIVRREVIDPPTFLEWNTWRVFLALAQAREVVAHLMLDQDLQPLSTAQGNQPDLEIDYGDFLVVAEVTLRTSADQRQAEARPVTRHLLEAEQRFDERAVASSAGQPRVYGLFIAPKIHPDTANDFFVALRYRVIGRREIVAIPLTVRQFSAALRPFAAQAPFSPAVLRRLLDGCYAAALAAETGEEWLERIDAALRRWLASLGVTAPAADAPSAIPLPLFV